MRLRRFFYGCDFYALSPQPRLCAAVNCQESINRYWLLASTSTFTRQDEMTNPGVSSRTAWKRLLLLGLCGLVVWWLYSSLRESARRDAFAAVDIDGVHHMGANFNIAQFFLDGVNGFNVGREGGAGSSVCCVLLPREWRPGLSVDLRWGINDWSKEISSAVRNGISQKTTMALICAGGPLRADCHCLRIRFRLSTNCNVTGDVAPPQIAQVQ